MLYIQYVYLSIFFTFYSQAIETRDTIAKFIYASLFEWLVQQVNKSLAVGENHTEKFISILAFYVFQPFQGKGTYKNDKAGLTLADLAYRRAKAVKATKRGLDSGKIVKNHQKKSNKSNPLPKPSSSRLEEMRELFQTGVKDKKPKWRGS
ncbi:unnamed protein product [Trifolium pratense]|uniref:Uncharacterized protein n=1 Tax=Trifolium pratense TaxID=57577 RepID=A0ACB0JIS8_TRIPR|nr:unnamed protein product [Trifolium pratense]